LEKNDAIELDLVDLFYYLKKKIALILVVTLVAVLLGCLITAFAIPNKYTASTRIYVINRSDDSVAYSDIQVTDKLLNDYKVLITGRNVTKLVVEELQLDMSYAELASCITVTAPENTRVVQINVEHTDPALAAKLANAVCKTAAEQIREIMAVEVNIIYEAEEPTAPTSPDVKISTLLAGVIGFVGVVSVLCVIYAMDDSIRSEEDVERYLGLSTLGIIPISAELGNMGKKKTARKRPAPRRQGGKK